MAEMDRALGGEYIFDRAFLESSVRELSRLTHQVVYSLNAMSGNGYAALFDRYQSIKDVLDDILAGGLGPFGRKYWISFGWPRGYTWVASAVFFSFWVWLWVLLFREGKRYPLMMMDAVCAGSLLTVAVALREPPVRTALSDLGFGAAAWVTLCASAALLIARAVAGHRRQIVGGLAQTSALGGLRSPEGTEEQ